MNATLQIAKRPPGEPPPSEDGEQVIVMRRRTRERLNSCGLANIADEAVLIVSELVTNAIVHSGGQRITVTLSRREEFLRIDVRDGVPSDHALTQSPSDFDEHGRGLVLVKLIAEEQRGAWGVEDGGATTWCELSAVAR
ncbi:ATP-binding protein [Streptomyces sp. NPDC046985]|uniref:ATP-binding protein n=1 Tax=Streptomyces sp. NPDC046985 TaxID=3155377 RepID=UPI0033E495D5